jgi:F420-non-reducing hydrogenase iron-sulfur subunit
MNEFEPKVVVFRCNWCSRDGKTSKVGSEPNFKIIRTMCSSRVDPSFVIKAFASGADGVMIMGCHPGDCHYLSGNYKTMRRVMLLKNMLSQFGIEPERLGLEWITPSEETKLPEVVGNFTNKVKELGPIR